MQPPTRLLALCGIAVLASTWGVRSAAAGDVTGTVSTRDGDLQDAVVSVERIEGKTFAPPETVAILEQNGLTFLPHVLPVLAGTSVTLPNNDVTWHNVFSPTKGRELDLGTYAPGTAKTIRFDMPGVTSLLCHVHPEMSAFIVVVETPYFAKSGNDGRYRIADLPPGRYSLAVWHELAQPARREIEVRSGNDLTVDFLLLD